MAKIKKDSMEILQNEDKHILETLKEAGYIEVSIFLGFEIVSITEQGMKAYNTLMKHG